MSKGWKAASVSGSANRRANEKKHCTGSVTVDVRAERLSQRLGREANEAEVYIDTHKKKDGTMVDEYSRAVVDEYNRKRNEKRRARRLSDRQSTADADATATEGEGGLEEGTEGEAAAVEGDGDGDDHVLDLDAWLHATGGPKKGRLIGFGPRVDARSVLDSSGTAADAWESQYYGTSSQADTRIEDLARQLEQERRLRQQQEDMLQVIRQEQEDRLQVIRQEQDDRLHALQQQQQQREQQQQQREEQHARAMQEQARVLEVMMQQVADLQRSRDPPPGDSSTAPHSPPSPS